MRSYRRLLFPALAGLLAAPLTPGQVFAHGGGGGGGHGGGGHPGGGHPGYGGHSYHGAPVGVYRRGYYGAYGFYPGFYGFGPYYPGFGYPGFGYPGFGLGLGYSKLYGPAAPYYIPGPAGGPSAAPGVPPAGPVPGANSSCVLDVRVPVPDAEVVVGGHITRQQGTERRFLSPSLVPGEEYSYTVTARWSEDGKPVERTRTVNIRAGQEVPVDFVTP